jgi:hypothetical protein
MTKHEPVRRRPAESAGLLGVIATAVARYAFHTDADLTATVGMIAGGVPAVVTALVAHGGISGWLGDLWHGGSD